MNVLERIDKAVADFLSLAGKLPSCLYLGQEEQGLLDRAGGMLVLRYREMEVVMVERGRYIGCGL